MKQLSALIFVCMLCACSSLGNNSQEVIEKRNLAAEYASSGNNYYSRGQYTQARELFELSLAYHSITDNATGIIMTYNSLGKTYLALGMPEAAVRAYNKASLLAASRGETILKALCLNNIGELYLSQNRTDDALTTFQQALALAREAGTPKDRAVIYHNLGTLYKRTGQPELALEYLNKSLDINRREKLYEEIANNYFMLSSLYSEQGDYETALTMASLALENDKFVENSLGIAKDYYALGIITAKAGDPAGAFTYFEHDLLIYQSLEAVFPLLSIAADKKNVIEYLISLADELGRDTEAAYYRELQEKD